MSISKIWKSSLTRYKNWYSSLNKPIVVLSLTATGLIGIFGYRVGENYFSVTNPLYVKGVALFRNNQIVTDIVGDPIKLKSIKGLLSLKYAMKMEDKVVFTVEFKGKNNNGVLTIYGLKLEDEWNIQRLEVKLRKEYYYKNYIIYRDAKNDTESIFL